MKNRLKIAVLAVFTVSGILCVRAELPDYRPYGGVDYMFMKLVASGIEGNLGVARAKLGAELNPYLALEGFAGTGLVSDDYFDGVNDVDAELEQIWGLSARGILPLRDWLKVYGLIGVTRTEFKSTLDGEEAIYTVAGYSYGVGVEAFPLDNLSVGVEFASLIDELTLTDRREEWDPKISGVSIGAKYYF